MSLILPNPRTLSGYYDDFNSTLNTTFQPPIKFPYKQWLANILVSAILLATVSYCLLAIIFYRCKKVCCRSKQGELAGIRGLRRRRRGTKRSILLLLLSVVVYISVIFYFCMQLSMVMEKKEPFCAYLTRASNICGLLVLCCVYISLWYRLNVIFYVDFETKFDNRRRAVSFLNKATLLFLFVATAVNAYSFITAPTYLTIPAGCVRVQNRNESSKKWYGLVTTTVLFQIALLFLYVYPLQLHRQCARDRGMRADFVIPKIKRACAMAIVCVVSDVGNVIIALLNKDVLHWTRHAVYGANLTINAVSLLFAYEDWCRCLFPFCTSSQRRTISRVSTIRTITCEYPPSPAALP